MRLAPCRSRWLRCATNMSNSSKLPSSSSTSSRSRAVSLPLACCAAIRAAPPPSRASARRASSWSRMSFTAALPADRCAACHARSPRAPQQVFGGFAKSIAKPLCEMQSCEDGSRTRKLYAGVKLREIRARLGMTQADYAAQARRLALLPQPDGEQPPPGLGPRGAGARRRVRRRRHRARRRLAPSAWSPTCARRWPTRSSATPPPLGDIQLVASNAPNLARALPDAAPRPPRDPGAAGPAQRGARPRGRRARRRCPGRRCATSSTTATTTSTRSTAPPSASPRLALGDPATAAPRSAAWLEARHGIALARRARRAAAPLRPRRPAPDALGRRRRPPTQAFQILHQIALIEHDDLLEATLDLARFRTEAARAICKTGLANYFAGAALLPYARFLERAQAAAPRPRGAGARLRRLDRAGRASGSRRCSAPAPAACPSSSCASTRPAPSPSATRRRGCSSPASAAPARSGTCTSAFETPGRFLRQLAETPDGVRYLCLARDVSKPGGSFRAPVQRYAIGLGCEIAHAGALVYADDLDLRNDAAYQPIGISCRICERRDCHQRAVPAARAPARRRPERARPAALPHRLSSTRRCRTRGSRCQREPADQDRRRANPRRAPHADMTRDRGSPPPAAEPRRADRCARFLAPDLRRHRRRGDVRARLHRHRRLRRLDRGSQTYWSLLAIVFGLICLGARLGARAARHRLVEGRAPHRAALARRAAGDRARLSVDRRRPADQRRHRPDERHHPRARHLHLGRAHQLAASR